MDFGILPDKLMLDEILLDAGKNNKKSQSWFDLKNTGIWWYMVYLDVYGIDFPWHNGAMEKSMKSRHGMVQVHSTEPALCLALRPDGMVGWAMSHGFFFHVFFSNGGRISRPASLMKFDVNRLPRVWANQV